MNEPRRLGAPRVGAVAIGRNEGSRLRHCLESLRDLSCPVVYVDSGSTDDSVALALSLGCDVAILDSSRPFTAAAARNAGLRRLQEIAPECEFVQFVDGDCEIVPGWVPTAAAFLENNSQYAVACGRRRERHPDRSLYNRLCDLEWSTPVGEAMACGGDALIRIVAIQEAGYFDSSLIAGEEPELCSRLLKAGWRIMRLDHEMTLHDANILFFRQWWRRTARGGWAFISGAVMDGQLGHSRWLREAARPWCWCALLPILSLICVLSFGWMGLAVLLMYPVIIVRAAQGAFRKCREIRTASAYGLLCLVGKFAELQGQLTWLRDHLLRRPAYLIEYKRPA